MFADKVLEYIASNRALQMWHRLNDSETDILKDFAAWLDENAVEQPLAPDAATVCPEHGEPVSNLIHFACGCFVTRPAGKA